MGLFCTLLTLGQWWEAFGFQVGGQWSSLDRSSCVRWGSSRLSHPATITTIWDGMRDPSAAVTCHTESAGERSPGGQGPGLNS